MSLKTISQLVPRAQEVIETNNQSIFMVNMVTLILVPMLFVGVQEQDNKVWLPTGPDG